jgi:hypothetical protein
MHYAAMTRDIYIHRKSLAAKVIGIGFVSEVGEGMSRIQWLWDKSESKPGTELRSI